MGSFMLVFRSLWYDLYVSQCFGQCRIVAVGLVVRFRQAMHHSCTAAALSAPDDNMINCTIKAVALIRVHDVAIALASHAAWCYVSCCVQTQQGSAWLNFTILKHIWG